jgi:hypothetical protein
MSIETFFRRSTLLNVMEELGFSTGCLYKTQLSLEDKLKIFLDAGANAVELSFATEEELLNFRPTEKDDELLKQFKYISVHAPWKGEVTQKTVEKLVGLRQRYLARAIILHPDVYDPELLRDVSMPLLIENMDAHKATGKDAQYFNSIRKNAQYCYCFDVQHAYEQDPVMKEAKNIIRAMTPRIRQMHVSGESSLNRHVPVYRARNQDDINKILKIGIECPKILEGVLDSPAEAAKEMNYIKQFP